MPVEFLTDEQAAAYGRFVEEPTRPELERFFFLDDVDRLGALGESASLKWLRTTSAKMLPKIDLPDLLFEVDSRTGFLDAFVHLGDGRTRSEDSKTSLVALLVSEACNIGYTPVIDAADEALSRARLVHVDQHYLRADTIAAANAKLIEAQGRVAIVEHWGEGLLAMLGYNFSPRFKDLADQRFWRAEMPGVDTGGYGPLEPLACNKVNLNKVVTHRPYMLRVVGPLVTGQVRAYDLLRMFGREGRPTPLGTAFAECGRIAKTLQEDQLGALGLVLNAAVLWTTRYLDASVEQLRALPADEREHDVLNEAVARLSPLKHANLNVLGRYAFRASTPAGGGLRPLRNSDAAERDDDDDDGED
ncbi:Tn3 family transposase [Streptomyces inhibens]|uniref:Tn3 family transposase n=1 Tax=Streptomyces inhibens TaxID=2293571 RepID=UPI0037A3D7DD